MSVHLAWLLFALLAGLIGLAGYHLSRHADRIAELTGLGRNFIGAVLLATVTSLPELISGVSAVRFVNDPNLAVGDILGSCVINLGLVVVLDFAWREGSVYRKATQGHLLSAALGMVLLSFVAFSLLAGPRLPGFRIGHVGGFTLLIPLLYFLSMKTLRTFEGQASAVPPKGRHDQGELRLSVAMFGLSAAGVVAAGAALPFLAKAIVDGMGWSSGFVGTVFLALSTSLPEIAVTVAAIRLKALELAFSNVLGSNLFNLVILFVDDLLYVEGPLLRHVDPGHSLTAILAVMMTGLVSIALLQPPQKKVLNTVSVVSILLASLLALNGFLSWGS